MIIIFFWKPLVTVYFYSEHRVKTVDGRNEIYGLPIDFLFSILTVLRGPLFLGPRSSDMFRTSMSNGLRSAAPRAARWKRRASIRQSGDRAPTKPDRSFFRCVNLWSENQIVCHHSLVTVNRLTRVSLSIFTSIHYFRDLQRFNISKLTFRTPYVFVVSVRPLVASTQLPLSLFNYDDKLICSI